MTSRRTEDDFRRDLEVKRSAAKSWRDHIKVHPAADLFPPMSPDELKALGEDIKKHGLKNRVHFIKGEDGEELVDGRNRLDAMEQEGLLELPLDGKVASWAHCADCKTDFDPYEYVVSANLHRRHLTAEDKRDLIAKLIKEKPEKSDRQISETVKASPTTVGKIRAEMEPTVQSGQLKRVGKDGKARKQPAKRRTPDDFAKDIAAKRASPVPPLSFPVPPADPADRDVGRRMEESARLVILEIDAMLRALDASPGAMKDPAGFGERLQMKATAFIELAQQKPPADDGFDIPPYLDRRVQR